MGNLTDWGDLTGAKNETSAFSSSTRGVWAGGTTGTYQNVIEYITFTTQSSPTDFGDLTVARGHSGGTSNSTRGLVFGGYDSTPNPDTMYNTIDYVTIASAGNATDFGDTTVTGWSAGGARSSTTRAVTGGYATPSNTNTIDYVTIATTGDASNFGDLIIRSGEVDEKENSKPNKKRKIIKNKICLSTFLHHFAITLVLSLLKLNI